MKKHTSSRSTLLLMEIIIAILFFSVASAVCLQLLAKSREFTKAAEELDMAVRQAGSVAEVIALSAQPMEQLKTIYTGSDIGEDGGFLYFDGEFRVCSRDQSLYRLKISPAPADGRTLSYGIAVYSGDEEEPFYSLEAVSYTQYTP